MGNDARNTRFARHPDDLIYRRDDADRVVRFVANMSCVNTAMARGYMGQIDHLCELGVAPRRIEQAARKTKGPLFHRLPNDRFHERQLVARRCPILHAEHLPTHRSVSDHLGDVHADAVSE